VVEYKKASISLLLLFCTTIFAQEGNPMDKNFFKRNYSILRILEIVIDALMIVFSFMFSVAVIEAIAGENFFLTLRDIFTGLFDQYATIFRTQILYIILILFFFVIYESSVMKKKYSDVITAIVLALTMSSVTLIVISFIFQRLLVPPLTLGVTLIVQIILFSFYKLLLYLFVRKINVRNVMIVGPKDETHEFAAKFLLEKHDNNTLKYILYDRKVRFDENLIDYIDKVDDIYITSGTMEDNKNNILTYTQTKRYKDVYLVPKLYEINIINSKPAQIGDTPLFLIQSLHLTLVQRVIKRLFDLVLSIIILTVLSPLILVLAIIIKLQDGGSVFYKQERITYGGKPFILYKFRSMIVDAEAKTGAILAQVNDDRITKIGKFLRKSRLDELPQLFNVIKGEMSLIGPRPEREIFIKQFVSTIPDYKYRINVKPGITGLAQVLGRYNTDPVDKLRFDLLYIRKYSIFLDIKIMLLTIKALFDVRSAEGIVHKQSFFEVIEKLKLHYKEEENMLFIEKEER
jgi:exopolysaccharide biosynthesis polyprenyl glycosylphosphotransferase